MADPTFKRIPDSLAPQIASYSLTDPKHPEIELAQVQHRLRLLNLWALKPGTRVVELGCGQGNTTAVLAEAVGPSGHIDAIDPGALDYGSPFTLQQAQSHLSASPVGERITWHQATPQEFLAADTDTIWDVAVLSHCIWYFSSEQVLHEIFTALKKRVNTICVAEYALFATYEAAIPHVLAVVARGTLESLKEKSTQNIRSPLSPKAIIEIAANSGWNLVEECTVVPNQGLLDGEWETGSVESERFWEDVKQNVPNERLRAIIRSTRDAVTQAVGRCPDGKIRTMDVWVSKFA
ncbi:S-adenosyl-L-methionine-dependent methyltransferase [Xylariaceae sp. FL1272]|nr:S-adenosyl-L-methionine-dependent methyltransferase [Xylariaceae sp. FL1272]